jgi:misacylated tRNA(Ala) deacylase
MPTELIFRDDAYVKTATATVTAVGDEGVELDRTIFYATGGGQPGDQGVLVRQNGERIAVVDARKAEAAGSVVHVLGPGSARLVLGEPLTLELNWERRYALMRMHTALHLLSCVVVAPVSGGNVGTDKGRLDFDIEMSQLDAEKITREANALIARAVDTRTIWITDAELDAQPELVKTMSVQPPRGAGRVRLLEIPGIDLQPCGGTHVRNIGEIKGLRVTKLKNEGKRNRRVEIALVD